MSDTGNQVILLDGNQRSCLAAVRSLGRQGIAVCVGEQALPCLASGSRYCRQAFAYPSAALDPQAFLSCVDRIARRNPGALLMPMTDVTMAEILSNADRFAGTVRIPFGTYRQYSLLSDKEALFRRSIALGIPVPETIFSTDPDLAVAGRAADALAARGVTFPVVVKPAASRIRTEREWIATNVNYAHSPRQLEAVLATARSAGRPCLIQEKITGPGIGIFLLLSAGKVIARFAHQRVREKPPSGGVSVVCRSIAPPADALQSAETLLGSSGWSGAAMVEFKRDKRDGRCKLMEINARFWGSLQLAVSAGVDFPLLLYCAANGAARANQVAYRQGLFSRWELGDLDHLLIRLKGSRAGLNLPPGAPSKLTTLANFLLDFVRPGIRSEVLRPNDPGPFLLELKQYVQELLR